jgi:hypothetical protein
MFINKDKVKELMDREANGNYNEFARQLQIDVAQLHRVLNTESKAGPKMLGKLMIYCNDRNLDFNEYIFLEPPLTACNNVVGS